jgi:hypothetical protein
MCRLLTFFYSIAELNLYIISVYIPTVHQLISSFMTKNKTTPSNAHSENGASQITVVRGADGDEEFGECVSLERLEKVHTRPLREKTVSKQVSLLASSL